MRNLKSTLSLIESLVTTAWAGKSHW